MARLRGVQLVQAQSRFEGTVIPTMLDRMSKDQLELLEALFRSSSGFVTESLRAATESRLRDEPRPVDDVLRYDDAEPAVQEELLAELRSAAKAKPKVFDKDKLSSLDPGTIREWMASKKADFKQVGQAAVIEAVQAIRTNREGYPRNYAYRFAVQLLRELGEVK